MHTGHPAPREENMVSRCQNTDFKGKFLHLARTTTNQGSIYTYHSLRFFGTRNFLSHDTIQNSCIPKYPWTRTLFATRSCRRSAAEQLLLLYRSARNGSVAHARRGASDHARKTFFEATALKTPCAGGAFRALWRTVLPEAARFSADELILIHLTT